MRFKNGDGVLVRAGDLTIAETLRLDEAERARALAELGLVLVGRGDGRLVLRPAPALGVA